VNLFRWIADNSDPVLPPYTISKIAKPKHATVRSDMGSSNYHEFRHLGVCRRAIMYSDRLHSNESVDMLHSQK
jgi:hypothetical protein